MASDPDLLRRKLCRMCAEILPLDAFPTWKSGRFGVGTRCRACCNITDQARRRANAV